MGFRSRNPFNLLLLRQVGGKIFTCNDLFQTRKVRVDSGKEAFVVRRRESLTTRSHVTNAMRVTCG